MGHIYCGRDFSLHGFYLRLSLVDSATVFKVSLTLIDQEGVVSGHLIGRTSPGGFMNIHEVTGGRMGAFGNATFP